MWSNLFVDYSLHKNFNVGFASHKNDIHLQLSQWQYWWWFWFTIVWILYFFVILRCYNSKFENFNITINTSLRSHGKWGDFLIAIIPLSWCGNILLNSNFILRMIEWQQEASLFTVRIQGKQWYWAYKYSSDIQNNISNLYINVGNNNWVKGYNQGSTHYTSQTLSSFVYEYEFKKSYKSKLQNRLLTRKDLDNLGKFSFVSNLHNYTSIIPVINPEPTLSTYKINLIKPINLNKKNINFLQKYSSENTLTTSTLKKPNITLLKPINWHKFGNTNYYCPPFFKNNKINLHHNYDLFPLLPTKRIVTVLKSNKVTFLEDKKVTKWTKLKFYKPFLQVIKEKHKMSVTPNWNFFTFIPTKTQYFETDDLDAVWDTSKNLRFKSCNFPIRLNRGVLNTHNIDVLNSNSTLKKNIFFNYQIINSNVTKKTLLTEEFWGFRQKRYRKMRLYTFPTNPRYNNVTYKYMENFLDTPRIKYSDLYLGMRNNRYKNELIPVTIARRLLRTKRTLILPAHINLTLITNSYDVVHSWFVPGLGLKIDCVPGRSTHHSLYIEGIGFYYGQCAEICGRFHHHMPIRVCALPFEHFVLWWQTRGLPRLYRNVRFNSSKSILLNKFKLN